MICRAALIAVLLVSISLAGGCSDPSSLDAAPTVEGLLVSGLRDEVIPLDTIRGLPAVSGDATTLDSAGNESVVPYAGTELDSILAELGVDRSELAGLRMVAVDGYSVELPRDMLQSRQVILAWSIDNRDLHDDELPLRAVVPGERAMYWVKGVAEIELVVDNAPRNIEMVVLLDNMIASLPVTDTDVDGEPRSGVALADIPGLSDSDRVMVVAADGLVKREAIGELPYRLVLAGDGAPLLTAPDLPRGMRLSNVVALVAEDTVYLLLGALAAETVPGQAVLDLVGDFLASGPILVETGAAGSIEVDLPATAFVRRDGMFVPRQ